MLQTYRCVEYDDDNQNEYTTKKEFLYIDPDVRCDSQKYKLMHTYAIINTIIWPVGIPISLFIWLSRLAKYLDPADMSWKEAIVARRDNAQVKYSSIAYVALMHKPRYWYYELIFNLSRRIMLTCAVLAFPSKGASICFVLFVCIIATVAEREMEAHVEPYVGVFVYCMSWQVLLCVLAMK